MSWDTGGRSIDTVAPSRGGVKMFVGSWINWVPGELSRDGEKTNWVTGTLYFGGMTHSRRGGRTFVDSGMN